MWARLKYLFFFLICQSYSFIDFVRDLYLRYPREREKRGVGIDWYMKGIVSYCKSLH